MTAVGVIACAGLLALLLAKSRTAKSDPLPQVPKRVLWAWERGEDLSFINPAKTGVAFWAGTIYLSGDTVRFDARYQPLRLPPNTATIAVVRIDAEGTVHPSLSAAQRSNTVEALLAGATAPGIKVLQIDFDAKKSQRDFYRSLLNDLRRRLPPALPVAITALASWCGGEDWLNGLPVVEAVPMLFSLGPDEAQVRHAIAADQEMSSPLCRYSYGVSIDEPVMRLRPERRIYGFSRKPWSVATVSRFMQENSDEKNP